MKLRRIASWVEIVFSALVGAVGGWALLTAANSPPDTEAGGWLFLGAVGAFSMALGMLIGGVSLRFSSPWHWLGHLPLAAILSGLDVLR
jgi:hypothetical protein